MTSKSPESPKTASSGPADGFPSPVWHATRWQAIRAGMWKAGKLGFFICFSLFLAVGVASVMLMLFDPATHCAVADELGPISPAVIARLIGLFILQTVGGGILFGTIPGVIVGGILAGVRWRRPDDMTESLNQEQRKTKSEVENGRV